MESISSETEGRSGVERGRDLLRIRRGETKEPDIAARVVDERKRFVLVRGQIDE
jgi:hypothetical protein